MELLTKFSRHWGESCEQVSHSTNPYGAATDGETEADHSGDAKEQ